MMREVQPDAVIDGRYQVIAHVGTGGMAEVFCATDLQLGRQVALKLLHDRFAQDEQFVERFRREASSAAGLQHQHVVSVYDRGEWNGTSYIAMEYVAGKTLKEVLLEDGPLPPERAVDLAVQILSAARFAHRRGVIHRDLKPHNVIVDEDGRAKVTDFGIAKAGASDMTMTGSIMGTAQYLSPEQAQGHDVSAQSDLYAVGIVLYELLTGRVPFEAESPVTIALKQVNEAPTPPSQLNPAVSADLERVILRAMEKEPARRFADADEFIAALEAVSEGQDTTAFAAVEAVGIDSEQATAYVAPVGPAAYAEVVREREPRQRKRWPWVLALVVLLAALAGGGAALLGGPDEKTVPLVVGSTVSTAEERLLREGFEPKIVRENSDEPRNEVIAQNPGGGSKAEEGATVSLTVSDGPAIVPVPDVEGDGKRTARRKLTKAGFKVTETLAFSDDVPRNRVIEQSQAAGSLVQQGTPIELTVSRGKERVPVPDVVGKSEQEARTDLEDAGFRVAKREEEATGEVGRVLAQDPAAATEAGRDSVVTITVSIESKEVTVPDVVGRSQAFATEALSQRGFEVDVSEAEVDTPDEDGKVQSQSPAGGNDAKADRGSSVSIVIGRFSPELDPENENTPTTPQTPTTPTPSTP